MAGTNGTISPTTPVVLFDGECGFCDKTVKWLIARDRSAVLRFAPRKSQTGQRLLQANHLPLDFNQSMILIEPPGRASVFSTGTFRILRHLPPPWNLIGLTGLLVPRFLRDAAYRVVASNRYRIAGKIAHNCRLPTPAERARYVDEAMA